jgi:hypothetical protein
MTTLLAVFIANLVMVVAAILSLALGVALAKEPEDDDDFAVQRAILAMIVLLNIAAVLVLFASYKGG